jgi:2-keto-3-deoxy-L-fuconate dehydrogenase
MIMAGNETRVAVVTGASGGLGRATCSLLKVNGYAVVGVDRSSSEPHDIDAFFSGDVCDESMWSSVVDHLKVAYGHVDALVNIAGRNYFDNIEDSNLSEWRSMMDTNVLGMVVPTKHLIGLLRRSAQASIVNMSSISGQIGSVGYAAYCTTKGAVDSLTKSLALELAPAVRVNAVAPGWIETPFTVAGLELAEDPAAYRRTVESMHALNRVGSPSEIAEGIIWLLSPAASFVTGTILTIDGGYLIKN